MTDPSGMSMTGQVEGLVAVVSLTVASVVVRARRAKVRQVRKLRALQRLSGIRPTVGHTTEDRSER